ncbi:MAG: hypothetical protein JW850_13315 [Thermoflexales bacterium]|nr:hypothetical protein [Thermoflexales bacterium]
MKKKPTRKQVRQKPSQDRRRESQHRRQSSSWPEEQLWRDMEPLASQFDLDDEEDWSKFASHVMHTATQLYDEPDFDDLIFEPADALYALTIEFNRHVPPPEELEQMDEDERGDSISEAFIHAVASFVTPELQRAVLSALSRCRRRLKHEGQKDRLALAAAVESFLRSESNPHIWGTCGLLGATLSEAIDEAYAFEESKQAALDLAQAIQADVEDIYDLQEDSAAYQAFWKAVRDTPGLEEYMERQQELEDAEDEEAYQLDSELADALLDPEETDEFLTGLVERLKSMGIDLESPDMGTNVEQSLVSTQISSLVQTIFSPERFQEMLSDLETMIEEEDEADLVAHRAQELYDELSTDEVSYWKNPFLAQFLFNAAISFLLGDAHDEEL